MNPLLFIEIWNSSLYIVLRMLALSHLRVRADDQEFGPISDPNPTTIRGMDAK